MRRASRRIWSLDCNEIKTLSDGRDPQLVLLVTVASSAILNAEGSWLERRRMLAHSPGRRLGHRAVLHMLIHGQICPQQVIVSKMPLDAAKNRELPAASAQAQDSAPLC